MSEFEQALLRLKSQINVTTDKEVAELLGMGEKALNARKRRGAFPIDKLRALAQRRPDLDIDVEAVLGGTLEERRVNAAAKVYAQYKPEPHVLREPTADWRPRAEQESALVEHWRACNPLDQALVLQLVKRLSAK